MIRRRIRKRITRRIPFISSSYNKAVLTNRRRFRWRITRGVGRRIAFVSS